MKLVLAEKASVAQSIAKVLGATNRQDGYLEGNGYIVSWCVGHLVELAQPEAYDERYGKWTYGDLPILPDDWKYEVSAGTRKQFGILKKLMARDDVASLVCATDAGREGELIFRLVYHQAGCRKPFERLWISSMEDQAIKDGFAHLEPSTKYDALYEAALCRERADWIVGMNATRLFSCLYHQTLNIGRVMTPTLAMVVMRDAEIAAFQPKPFYTVQLGLNGITAASRRFDEKGDAQQLLAKCKETMKAVIKSMDRKEKTERAIFCLNRVNLNNVENLYPAEISGGMKKRVAIARAIVLQPKYLFCDEPNSGLDPLTSIVIDNLLSELTHEYDMTTVINTHDMNSVFEIGEKVLFIHEGHKEWEGSNEEIMYTNNKALNEFLFSSKLNRMVREKLGKKSEE